MEKNIKLRANVILDTIKGTVLKSKVHGLSNMFRVNSKIMKLIWFIFFFSSMGYCIYQIFASFYQFFKFEVLTIKRIYYETPTLFPTVDICNLDAYDGNTARRVINDIINGEKLDPLNFSVSRMFVDKASDLIKSNLEKKANNKTFDMFLNGFYLSQMLITCYYNNKKCDSSDFYYYHDYNYGSCYSFNNGISNNASNDTEPAKIPLKNATNVGWTNGLQLELFVGNPKEQQQYNFKSGVRVLVRNHSDFPFPNDDGMDVATGIQTNIGVIKEFTKHLPYPFSQCVNDASIDWTSNDVLAYMKRSFDFKVYSQRFCLKVCRQKLVIENCTCYDLRFQVNESTQQNTEGCTSNEKVECAKTTKANYYKNQKKVNECLKKCPIECESQEFLMRTTYAKYPTKWASDLLLKNDQFKNLVVNNTISTGPMPYPTLSSLKATVLMVNVYYEQMFYYETTEEARLTLESLIATIGGHFGLFLGVTILTFVEIIEIIFNLVYLIIKSQC